MCLCTRETECNNAETDFDQHITRIIYSFVEAKNLTFLLSSLWFLGWFLRRQCGQSQFKQQQRSTWQQHNIHLSSVCPLSLSGCGLIQSCDPTCLVCVCVCLTLTCGSALERWEPPAEQREVGRSPVETWGQKAGTWTLPVSTHRQKTELQLWVKGQGHI